MASVATPGAPDAGRRPPPARRVLLIGGARSGKSAAAEARAAAAAGPGGPVRYVATGASRPDDAEWAARVAAHRARRPDAWVTIETADPVGTLAEPGVVLLDCLALWLARALDDAGVWGAAGTGADARLAGRVTALVEAWAASPAYLVGVSNEVGMGVVPATAAGRRFRDELGALNARLAAASDDVFLVVAGRLLRLEAP
jgi:adenosylcobinamide kinase/adenosylcobinamide-phosphate guanylyltransferase